MRGRSALVELIPRHYDHIDGEIASSHRMVSGLGPSVGRLIGTRHDHQKIDVAFRSGIAPRLGAKDVNSFRLEGSDQPLEYTCQFACVFFVNMWQLAANSFFNLFHDSYAIPSTSKRSVPCPYLTIQSEVDPNAITGGECSPRTLAAYVDRSSRGTWPELVSASILRQLGQGMRSPLGQHEVMPLPARPDPEPITKRNPY